MPEHRRQRNYFGILEGDIGMADPYTDDAYQNPIVTWGIQVKGPDFQRTPAPDGNGGLDFRVASLDRWVEIAVMGSGFPTARASRHGSFWPRVKAGNQGSNADRS